MRPDTSSGIDPTGNTQVQRKDMNLSQIYITSASYMIVKGLQRSKFHPLLSYKLSM